ncbi:MAG: cation diffusion facilitator family transporter [Halanaerobiales bacterium]|nr:cation diffusion facilitator family transporter [Halanaerobiales bacterium]
MDRYKQGKRVSVIIIIGNVLLAVLKVGIGIVAGSSALIADGFHSVSDIVSTLAVIIAINVANKPPDEKHPYGHGQAEPIAAKILGIILVLTGAVLAFNTGKNLISGAINIPGLIGFWVALFSIAIKEIMFRYTFKIGKETDNQALIADAWHHRSDAISSIAAAVGILGSYLGYSIMDPIAAIIVAFMIIRVGWKVLKDAITSLMVTSPPEAEIKKIRRQVKTVPGVEEVADLKAHYNGVDLYIDLKILVDYSLSVLQGHQIASEVKRKIFVEFPEAREVLIHVDPMLPAGEP